MIRSKILSEYKDASFDPTTKLSYIDGANGEKKPLFSCTEKIKFFNADYPSGTIKTEVVMDNNIFATVRAIVTCVDGSREAFGKWYRSNSDVFGMNYLGTAQTVAISKALTLMGYSANGEDNVDPDGSKNIAPEETAPPEDDLIPLSPPVDISQKGMTLDQALATVMYNIPFNGRSIKQILSEHNPGEIATLHQQLEMELDMQTSRAAVAKVILPLLSQVGSQ